MSEKTYPISCQSCGKRLFGPVHYCPYCAVPSAVTAAKEAPAESVTKERVVEAKVATQYSPKVSVQPSAPTQHEPPPVSFPKEAQKIAPEVHPPEQKSEPVPVVITEKHKSPVISTPSKSKWIAVVAVVVVGIVAGFLFTHKKVGASLDQSGSAQTSSTSTPVQGQKESARIVALDTLRRGTDLSLTISKLPKLVKVVEAAKKLGEISPRYQEQITMAKKTLGIVQKDQDKCLVAYFGKIVELDHFTPDQITYAMNVIRNGDLSPREKCVAELLTVHVTTMHANSNTDPKKLLSDFTGRFSNFVE